MPARKAQLDSVADRNHTTSHAGIEAAVRRILHEIGEDPDHEGLLETPKRFAEALLFSTKGYSESIEGTINDAIFHVDTQDLVIVRDIHISSFCEHHIMPFTGKVRLSFLQTLT